MKMGERGPVPANQECHDSRRSEAEDLGFAEQLDRFRRWVVADLPPDDWSARLERRRHVLDCLELDFSRDAAQLDARFAGGDAEDELDAPTAGEWIRHHCKMSSSAANDRVNVGEQLARLPRCGAAVVAGEIGFAHLSVIARTTKALAEFIPESRPESNLELAAPAAFDEGLFLATARESSVGRLCHYCVRVRHALNPDLVAHEQRVAVEERALRLTTWEDGSLLISGQLDPMGGAALRTALEPLARPMGEGDDRGLERRQADAMVELSSHALDAGLVPQRAGQRPHLLVTTSLETLRGLEGSPAADMEFSMPISSKTVQRIACDASITRIVFGPGSVVVDVGRATRAISGPTRRALNACDQSCRWPGCERPASWSAAHHVVHWTQGGDTDLANLILLCLRHHWMVHEGGWKLVRAKDDRVLAIPPTYSYPYPPRAPDNITTVREPVAMYSTAAMIRGTATAVAVSSGYG